MELLRSVAGFVTPQLSSKKGHVALEMVLPEEPLWVMVDTKHLSMPRADAIALRTVERPDPMLVVSGHEADWCSGFCLT